MRYKLLVCVVLINPLLTLGKVVENRCQKVGKFRYHYTKLCFVLGVFDTVTNLGALIPRIIFSQYEAAAYHYFSQRLLRGITAKEEQQVSFFFLIL